MSESLEFVYFITYQGGPIKIGKAKNVDARMKTLQTSLPHKLEALGVCEGLTGLEGILHGKFRHLRIEREWFRDCEELRAYIAAHAKPLAEMRGRMDLVEHRVFRNRHEAADRTRIEQFKVKYRSELEEVVSEIAKEAARKLNAEMIDRIGDHFASVTASLIWGIRDLTKFMDNLEAWASQRGIRVRINDQRIELRRTVDHMLGTSWKFSKELLASDSPGADAEIERFAKRQVIELFGAHFPTYEFDDLIEKLSKDYESENISDDEETAS